MSHISRKYLIPLVIAVLAVVYLGIASAYRIWPFTPFSPPATEQIGGDEEGVDELASWQTYRNEEFGFEVKYPGDWLITISEGQSINVPEVKAGSIHISILNNSEKLPLLEFLKAKDEEFRQEQEGTVLGYPGFLNFSDIKQIAINGKIAYKFGPFHFSYSEVVFESNSGVILVKHVGSPGTLLSDQESEDVFNQILSTFKFIK